MSILHDYHKNMALFGTLPKKEAKQEVLAMAASKPGHFTGDGPVRAGLGPSPLLFGPSKQTTIGSMPFSSKAKNYDSLQKDLTAQSFKTAFSSPSSPSSLPSPHVPMIVACDHNLSICFRDLDRFKSGEMSKEEIEMAFAQRKSYIEEKMEKILLLTQDWPIYDSNFIEHEDGPPFEMTETETSTRTCIKNTWNLAIPIKYNVRIIPLTNGHFFLATWPRELTPETAAKDYALTKEGSIVLKNLVFAYGGDATSVVAHNLFVFNLLAWKTYFELFNLSFKNSLKDDSGGLSPFVTEFKVVPYSGSSLDK